MKRKHEKIIYLMDCILYQIFKIILGYLKKHGEKNVCK